jgi:hypothetical protein
MMMLILMLLISSLLMHSRNPFFVGVSPTFNISSYNIGDYMGVYLCIQVGWIDDHRDIPIMSSR